MRMSTLNGAILLARMFLREAELLKKQEKDSDLIYGSKLSGSVRRKSMDLTRALAEMRKA